MTAPAHPDSSPAALGRRLDDVMIADARRLRRRLDDARRERDGQKRATTLEKIERSIAEAEHRLARREASRPAVTFPPELPVSQRRDELAEAIRDHQVVIVAGETGSGKTTQLPKICLELGRGARGMIGHTQPRRLAARTVADRIADELHTELGGTVGYAVRFTDKVGDDTLIKLMTDGILLAEVHRDRSLSAYDTIIIDEAHERSLNVDFLLGYLKQLLPRRPDLKVIVTSATIDPQRFSRHFDDAPVVEVSGRTYPVELRYRPLDPTEAPATDEELEDRDVREDPDDEREARRDRAPGRPVRDQIQAICDAVDELRAEPPGDVLVFLSGEREIRDTTDALRALNLASTEVLPLYARLPTAEQHRIFAPHQGRRIVLATNVAETSLTVPGIRYVVDPGTARISRYSHRLKVQRLPIEDVSQASANQRAGRCGRVAPGICIRLFSEDDYDSRPAFTEPEILRTNLASVILQMTSLGLGDIAAFPFVEPPDRRSVTDGVRLLQELGALEVDEDRTRELRLTPIGRQLARLPVDPRFGRMVLEAARTDCLREVLIIAAALSIEDPRERPAEKAGTADQWHARFKDEGSDFVSYLNLWQYVREQQRALSSSRFRRLCRAEMLNYLRIREWQDVHSQLRQIAAELGLRQRHEPAEPDTIHRALLSGLLSHIGIKDRDTREFRGARNARFAVFPGSALARKPPQWVMAAELVETSRLWARTVARIHPEWAEELAPHLVTRSYSDPHWSAQRGQAMAYEAVSLYGLPIVTRRLVPLSKVDPEHAREVFVQHALVEGDWTTHHRFFTENRARLHELAERQNRYRRNDLVIDDDALYRLYDDRIAERVTSGRQFDSWWKKVRRTQPDLLTFGPDELLTEAARHIDDAGFPDEWHQGDLTLPLTYAFRPGRSGDGVTVHIPLAVLNQVRDIGFDWQVPGLREERIATLIRTLPKAQRRPLVPVAETARAVLGRLTAGPEPLIDALARELARIAGEPIPRAAFDLERVPPHLSMTYVVEDEQGRIIGDGTSLSALQDEFAPDMRAAIGRATKGIEQAGLTTWSIGALPRRLERTRHGHPIVAYPALVDEGESVAVRVFDNELDQHEAMWDGTRRLLRLATPVDSRALRDRLTKRAQLALAVNPYPSTAALVEDAVSGTLDALLAEHGGPAWDAVGFDRLHAAVGSQVRSRATEVVDLAAQIFVAAAAVDRRLVEPVPLALGPALDDMTDQRTALLPNGFIAAMGPERLPDLLRYLRAIDHRLDQLPRTPGRDRERMEQVHRVERAYAAAIPRQPPGSEAELEHIGWMIEELRVSLFAQPLGTPEPVSVKRIAAAINALPV